MFSTNGALQRDGRRCRTGLPPCDRLTTGRVQTASLRRAEEETARAPDRARSPRRARGRARRAAAARESNRRAMAGREAPAAEREERQQGVGGRFPERRRLPSRTQRGDAGRDEQRQDDKPTSSASDGSIATRTGAAVVPATSNDARLSQSAMPATVAALTAVTAGPRNRGSGLLIRRIEHIGSRRTGYAGPDATAPRARTRAAVG